MPNKLLEVDKQDAAHENVRSARNRVGSDDRVLSERSLESSDKDEWETHLAKVTKVYGEPVVFLIKTKGMLAALQRGGESERPPLSRSQQFT